MRQCRRWTDPEAAAHRRAGGRAGSAIGRKRPSQEPSNRGRSRETQTAPCPPGGREPAPPNATASGAAPLVAETAVTSKRAPAAWHAKSNGGEKPGAEPNEAGPPGAYEGTASHGEARSTAIPTPNWKNATPITANPAKVAMRAVAATAGAGETKKKEEHGREEQRRHQVGGVAEKLHGHRARMHEGEPHLVERLPRRERLFER